MMTEVPIAFREIWRSALLIGVAITVAMVVPYGVSVILLALAGWALRDVESSLKALSLAVIIKIINPAIVGGSFGPVSLLGWLVIGAAGVRILSAPTLRDRRAGPLYAALLMFTVIVFVLSLTNSEYIQVSLFKIFSFAFTVFVVFRGFQHLAGRRQSLFPWILAIWSSVLGLSLLILAVPAIAYFRDRMGFQGVLNHPQAMAIFCAPAAAWASASIWTNARAAGRITWLIFVLSWGELILSRGRTGVVAIALAGLLALLLALLGHAGWRKSLGRAGTSPRNILAVVFVLTALAVFPSQLLNGINSFIYKQQVGRTLESTFESSRGFLITESITNFKEKPWGGIGFGVSKSRRTPFRPVIEPITGLPISASTEKANLPVAILEEIGLVGSAAFVPFLILLVAQAQRRAPLEIGCLLLAAMTVNVGETIFFSMGGPGLYAMLLIGFAAFHCRSPIEGENRLVGVSKRRSPRR